MIDGMDGIQSYLRDAARFESQVIISASGRDARTPRSVEASGQEERGLRFLMSGGLVSGTSSSSGVLMSDAGSGGFGGQTFTVYMPMTEVGAYMSDQIADNVKFTAGLVVGTCVPQPARDRRPH